MTKKKILIVDDDRDFLRLATANLKKTNMYEVKVGFTGNVALSLALEFKPDLIILDVLMPDVDGGEVASQIKANPELKDIPLVYLTSLIRKEEAAAEADSNYLDKHNFIEKMTDREELVNYMEGLFSRK